MDKRRTWTEADEVTLAALWPDPAMTCERLEKILPHSRARIADKAKRLGLRKLLWALPQIEKTCDGIALHLPGTAGARCFIDAVDLDRVINFPKGWIVHREGSGALYVYSRATRPTVKLHRFILSALPGQLIDHKDGDGLNNRRSNIRIADPQQNTWNSRPKGQSGYCNVWFHKYSGLWTGTVRRENGHRKSIGYFTSPEEAARASDALRLELRGDWARLNFPSDERGSS